MSDLTRPYLVIPKLIEQPTWGGEYIVNTKQWQTRPGFAGQKIGQSYELFSGSNLSLCESSDDPDFVGELTDRDAVQLPTTVPNSVPLRELIKASPEEVLGREVAEKRGNNLNVLIKLTQALGNSFQVHLKDGGSDPYWIPKLETWYYFEPGLLTLGVKQDADWDAYQNAAKSINGAMQDISKDVQSGRLSYEAAQPKIQALLKQYDPWQFVNVVEVGKDTLVDLSSGGIHHSWEEDTERLPLGNVLYEVQNEAMDDISTLRSFDRGKMSKDGSIRKLQIDDYFRLVDRSPEANDPKKHITQADQTGETLQNLTKTSYYTLDKLSGETLSYKQEISQFVHLFVQKGKVVVSTPTGKVEVGTGHACFIPAAAGSYSVSCDAPAEVLITY
ncbi:MAG TPA: hypothetical protein VG604_02450 [Candidatus Saccharimonadales bacterium]|nr:hypothetical protein [Candidatus Saccharimonadales bacterium]